jgi:hypothetical protein
VLGRDPVLPMGCIFVHRYMIYFNVRDLITELLCLSLHRHWRSHAGYWNKETLCSSELHELFNILPLSHFSKSNLTWSVMLTHYLYLLRISEQKQIKVINLACTKSTLCHRSHIYIWSWTSVNTQVRKVLTTVTNSYHTRALNVFSAVWKACRVGVNL